MLLGDVKLVQSLSFSVLTHYHGEGASNLTEDFVSPPNYIPQMMKNFQTQCLAHSTTFRKNV
jgi:hypothetical protein